MSDANDLGPLPLIHPREAIVETAKRKLESAVLDVVASEEFKALTEAEYTKVINLVLSDRIASLMRHLIRIERHGDSEKPGGWA
jgi:hypothetical protein